MHELFYQVLNHRDLSKAGDLFSVEDDDIKHDLSEVLQKIEEIAYAMNYLCNDNIQSVVEICITRVTSAIRETRSIEQHAPALVSLLQSCLRHNLRPSVKDEDPPHAKIASDILSCVFLNYAKKSVMEIAIPVAVKFLDEGNRELCRNISSYLSLAAIDNSGLLAKHLTAITDSCVSGNHSLIRVLPQVCVENPEPVYKRIVDIVNLLRSCDTSDQTNLLNLLAMIAKQKPELLEPHIGQLCEYLNSTSLGTPILQMFLGMAVTKPLPFVVCLPQLKQCLLKQPTYLGLAVKVISAVGMTSKSLGSDCAAFMAGQLSKCDSQTMHLVLKELQYLTDYYPHILPAVMDDVNQFKHVAPVAARAVINQLNDNYIRSESSTSRPGCKSAAIQTEGIVTVVTIGSSTRLSETGVPKSGLMTTSNSMSQHITEYRTVATSTHEMDVLGQIVPPKSASIMSSSLSSSLASCNTSAQPPLFGTYSTLPGSRQTLTSKVNESSTKLYARERLPHVRGHLHSSSLLPASSLSSSLQMSSMVPHSPTAVINPSSQLLATPLKTPTLPSSLGTDVPNLYMGQPHAIPFRDAVQQFCEKHMDKIKDYMQEVFTRIPIPIKAIMEERKHKRDCRLHFVCLGQAEHCLYAESFFKFRTHYPRTWIHLMFLAIQSHSSRAVCQQDPSVGNLKACWDRLRLDSGNSFVRLVTSSFPSSKDQDILLNELQSVRYFDLLEFNQTEQKWLCFVCNNPEKVADLLLDGDPTIEGQLKGKKGKWKFLKRWKTRYFTLSGATITYNKRDTKESLPVSKIQSVKAVKKGTRDIPKAFEIFTNEQTYVFKVKDDKNIEQWVQCLQIAVARSQKSDSKADKERSKLPNWDLGSGLVMPLPLTASKPRL